MNFELKLNALVLKHNDFICFQIIHIYCTAFFPHQRVFPGHQPAEMREKEATICVMWICICIAVFMVQTMVTYPRKNRILKSFYCLSRKQFFLLTWPEVVCKKTSIQRKRNVALYVLWAYNRWAHAVIPKPLPTAHKRTEDNFY